MFSNDIRHGYGSFYWKDGRVYEGSWNLGKQHGYGAFVTKEGEKKYGLWLNGTKKHWFTDEQKK